MKMASFWQGFALKTGGKSGTFVRTGETGLPPEEGGG